MKTILKSLVGSRAHGLATPESDWDWRGVYVAPTTDILTLGDSPKQGQWLEGDTDDTSYEIGKFLHLASKSNPSYLELLVSGQYDVKTEEGELLLDLFPSLWSSKGVYNAFLGYSKNQEKKMLDDNTPQERVNKYAVACLRVLNMGHQLLTTGFMTMKVHGEFANILREIRQGKWGLGPIIDLRENLRHDLNNAYANNDGKETDMDAVNDYLLTIRKNNW